MRHCQDKVMHMLLVVWFIILKVDNYFVLVAFQMAQPTLYIVWHVILSTCEYDLQVQILTCLD